MSSGEKIYNAVEKARQSDPKASAADIAQKMGLKLGTYYQYRNRMKRGAPGAQAAAPGAPKQRPAMARRARPSLAAAHVASHAAAAQTAGKHSLTLLVVTGRADELREFARVWI